MGFIMFLELTADIVEAYKEDLIVLTGNLYGEVPSKILNVGEQSSGRSPVVVER